MLRNETVTKPSGRTCTYGNPTAGDGPVTGKLWPQFRALVQATRRMALDWVLKSFWGLTT